MKNLFVSPARVRLQNYRTGIPFRLAAVIIFAGALLQIPLGVGAFAGWRRYRAAQDQQGALQAEAHNLQAELIPLQDAKRKLQQIHAWEPILRSRLPISALLSAVENSMPDEAVLASISIEADQFDRVPVNGGVYRVPTNYRLLLQGETGLGHGTAVQTLNDNLLRRLPPGSEEIRNERQPKATGNLYTFTLQYSLKPNGNYFGLGVKRIADPDPL